MTTRPPVDLSVLMAVAFVAIGGACLLLGVYLILPPAVLVVVGAGLLYLASRLP